MSESPDFPTDVAERGMEGAYIHGYRAGRREVVESIARELEALLAAKTHLEQRPYFAGHNTALRMAIPMVLGYLSADPGLNGGNESGDDR